MRWSVTNKWQKLPWLVDPHDLKGQAIAAFVTVTGEASEELRKELRMHVRAQIGALAQPDDIRFTASLPKNSEWKDHAATIA